MGLTGFVQDTATSYHGVTTCFLVEPRLVEPRLVEPQEYQNGEDLEQAGKEAVTRARQGPVVMEEPMSTSLCLRVLI